MVEDERVYCSNIGDRLRLARGENTQPVLAKLLGVNKNTILRYEKGLSAPDIVTVRKICYLTGVSLDWLVYGKGPMWLSDIQEGEAKDTHTDQAMRPEDAFDSLDMAEGIGLLAEIYRSKDNIYIRAINANLLAFSDAVKTKAKMADMAERMQEQFAKMEEKLNALEREVVRLRHENGELKRELRARSDRDDPISATG